ncbi:MoaD/ThiS family protein [Streptomyces sp. NPDC006700]|uniref:MoaD/ThiS family protein n=1 Tax=unclassified Streptomyces TaxID=2593676 RepID=UPI0033D9EA16
MAIEVRVPTILRQYTDGQKAVDGNGETLAELFADLETRHPGIQARIVDGEQLRRFVNVYLNDEDVRFLDGISTKLTDGDSVTILPAVAGGSAAAKPRPAGVGGRATGGHALIGR